MIVSFIVPVYKVEKYIGECISSITCQTFGDFEIIIVDDGSPDNSPEICDVLASRDSRIKVIHKPNGGLSDARNCGLKAAKGDYVVFIDGDDFWTDQNSLQKLVDIIEEYPQVDFVGFNCGYFFTEGCKYKKWVSYDSSLKMPIDKNIAITKLVESGTFPMSACFKIIKRSFLINNDLFFIKDLLAEDVPWFLNVLDKCNLCIFVNEYIYAYRQTSGSCSITHQIGKKNIDSLLHIIDRELKLLDCRSFDGHARKALLSFLAYEYCLVLSFLQYLPANERKPRYVEAKKLTWLLKNTNNPKVKKVHAIYRISGLYFTMKVLQYYLRKRGL
jgi:glycosyltransferase involved in cell wall biosynthesis